MISFHPNPGDVLLCDFAGYRPPEIVRRRPVVVLAEHRADLPTISVVPLCLTAPYRIESWHVPIATSGYGFLPQDPPVMWAKGDLIAHVAYERLDRLRLNGLFARCQLTPDDFRAVQQGAAAALGFEVPRPIAADLRETA